MNRNSVHERLRGKHPFDGHYEVMGSVELSDAEAEAAELQIAEADAERPPAQVSFAWVLRSLRSEPAGRR